MSDEVKIPKVDETETLLVVKQGKLKAVGSREVKRFMPGQKIQMVGLDKIDALGQGKVTRDLKAEVPENSKRKAPKAGEEKFADPVTRLSEKIDQLIESNQQLIAAVLEKKK